MRETSEREMYSLYLEFGERETEKDRETERDREPIKRGEKREREREIQRPERQGFFAGGERDTHTEIAQRDTHSVCVCAHALCVFIYMYVHVCTLPVWQ